MPTNVNTFRVIEIGPSVNAIAIRSTDKGPSEASTDVVRKSRAALSGKNSSDSFVNNPPRNNPSTKVQMRRTILRHLVSTSITSFHR